MKGLFDFITEKREYFNPEVTLDTLKRIFQEIDEDDVMSEESFNEIRSALEPMFAGGRSFNRWDISGILMAYFYSQRGMGGKYNTQKAHEFMDMLRRQPLDRIKRILGAGGEGMVYDLGNGSVLKVLWDVDFLSSRKHMLQILRDMLGKHFETLPDIYKVTDEYIIREDCTPDTRKCHRYYDIATTKFPGLEKVGGTMEQGIARGYIYDVNVAVPKTKEVQEVRRWLLRLKKELASVGYEPTTNFGDFKPANLGETKDGRVVYFDW